MLIHCLPLNALGYCHIDTGEIFISSCQSEISMVDTLKHELAHLISGCADHSNCWYEWFLMFKPNNKLFKHPPFWTGGYTPNIGNISGVQNILTDLVLLQRYRRWSQEVLGTVGHWEVINETVDGGPGDQLIRLYPTPKGSFPVVVLYYPVVTAFRSPQAKMLAYDMLLAEAKIMVGALRRKIAGIPMPDGGQLALDGEALAAEGKEEREAIIEKAIMLGEPMPILVA